MQPVIIEKEKRLVAQDRAADVSTKFVPVKRRPRLPGGKIVERIRVQDRVFNIFIGFPMKLIRAGLRHHLHVDDAAVTSIHADAADFDFLQRTQGGQIDSAEAE